MALEKDVVPVGELIWSASQTQREAFTRRAVNLVAEAESAPGVAVDVDRRRMGQVLDNLLANALRHTPAGGSVRLFARQTSNEVEIVIADTGEGIPPDQLSHVFERFYRGDTARDRDRGGSGIGLTISRAIVDAHGGGLTASSDGPGCGATFTIALPVSPRSPLASPAQPRAEH